MGNPLRRVTRPCGTHGRWRAAAIRGRMCTRMVKMRMGSALACLGGLRQSSLALSCLFNCSRATQLLPDPASQHTHPEGDPDLRIAGETRH